MKEKKFMSSKNLLNFTVAVRAVFILITIFAFSSCLIFNTEQPLTVDKIEYIDDTHFKIYCTGYGEDGLPADDYIIVSDEYTKNKETKITHTVKNRTYEYMLFISIGVVAEFEVDPPFESGEKVVVWLDTPFEDTYGYAEFTIPEEL